MNTGIHFRLPGYGLAGAGDTAVQIGSTVAQGASTIALTSTATGTALAASLGGAAIAVPVVGAAIAGIALGIEAILHSGCGQTCIETSQWANQAEELLKQNVNAYFAIAAPRPQSVQQSALANFTNVWNRLVQLCSQSGLGTAGTNCIKDRQAGGCKWKATAPQYPGQPAQGTCWNWWNGYHDPIANDSQTYNDSISSATGATAGGSATAATGGGSVLWIAAAVAAGLFLVMRS